MEKYKDFRDELTEILAEKFGVHVLTININIDDSIVGEPIFNLSVRYVIRSYNKKGE